MVKKAFCLSFIILVGLAGGVMAGIYSGGDGSVGNPYRISNADDMNEIGLNSSDWASHFVLTDDINLSGFDGTEFNIIGNSSIAFSGVFDGNGFTISNFTYESTGVNGVGIFSYVNGSNVVIKDLTLADPNVDGGSGGGVGCLVGQIDEGTIFDCGVEGGSVSGAFYTGGLVGANGYNGIISNSYAVCSVDGWDITGGLVGVNAGMINDSDTGGAIFGINYVGGLAGYNYYGGLLGCFSTAMVEGDWGVGGLVGMNYGDGATISGCYARGDVSGIVFIGGLVGRNHSLISNCYARGVVEGGINTGGLAGEIWDGVITNSYSASFVSGDDFVGGLVGYHLSGSYSKCFWDDTVNPLLEGIGNGTNPNVAGESTTNMQKEDTFTEAGWDFIEIWDIGENQTYPFLRVYPAGDLSHDGGVDMLDFVIIASRWLEGV